RHFTNIGERWGQFGALLSLAAAAAAHGNGEVAAKVVGAAESFSETIGAMPIPVWERELTFARDRVAQLLGPRQLRAALAAGRALSTIDAIAFALALELAPASANRP